MNKHDQLDANTKYTFYLNYEIVLNHFREKYAHIHVRTPGEWQKKTQQNDDRDSPRLCITIINLILGRLFNSKKIQKTKYKKQKNIQSKHKHTHQSMNFTHCIH